jgi:hypothetical protein
MLYSGILIASASPLDLVVCADYDLSTYLHWMGQTLHK